MTGWIVYDIRQYEKNRWFADRLAQCLSETSEVKLVLVEKLQFGTANGTGFWALDGERIEAPDYAVVRTIFPLLSSALEASGCRVFNSSEVSEICNDKRYTYQCLSGAGIPVLDTVFCDRRFFDAENAGSFIGFPMVLKSASGHGGTEVFLIDDVDALKSAVRELPDDRFLIQKVCPSVGKDVRVYVLGGRILAAALRSSDNFKSNFSLGGRASKYSMNENEEKLVYQVLNKLPFDPDFVGIDFLVDRDEWYFNEIEDVVGTRMLYECFDMDAAKIYAEYILRETAVK